MIVLRDDVFDWQCDDQQAERIQQGILAGERVHEGRVEALPVWFWVPLDHHKRKDA